MIRNCIFLLSVLLAAGIHSHVWAQDETPPFKIPDKPANQKPRAPLKYPLHFHVTNTDELALARGAIKIQLEGEQADGIPEKTSMSFRLERLYPSFTAGAGVGVVLVHHSKLMTSGSPWQWTAAIPKSKITPAGRYRIRLYVEGRQLPQNRSLLGDRSGDMGGSSMVSIGSKQSAIDLINRETKVMEDAVNRIATVAETMRLERGWQASLPAGQEPQYTREQVTALAAEEAGTLPHFENSLMTVAMRETTNMARYLAANMVWEPKGGMSEEEILTIRYDFRIQIAHNQSILARHFLLNLHLYLMATYKSIQDRYVGISSGIVEDLVQQRYEADWSGMFKTIQRSTNSFQASHPLESVEQWLQLAREGTAYVDHIEKRRTDAMTFFQLWKKGKVFEQITYLTEAIQALQQAWAALMEDPENQNLKSAISEASSLVESLNRDFVRALRVDLTLLEEVNANE